MRTALNVFCLLGSALLPAAGSAQSAASASRHERIEIVQPQDQSTVFDNSGHVDVQVRISPPVEPAPGEHLVLLLDERLQPQQGTALDHVERGMHRLQARIVDNHGHTIIESGPITFYLWQASRNFPSRR
jgi:hypothetical protein